jgi:hypothetical protein
MLKLTVKVGDQLENNFRVTPSMMDINGGRAASDG